MSKAIIFSDLHLHNHKDRVDRLQNCLDVLEWIFEEAKKLQASKVVVEMLEAQRSGQAIFSRLGFRIEGTLVNHARDRFGKHHNLVVMATLVDDATQRQ